MPHAAFRERTSFANVQTVVGTNGSFFDQSCAANGKGSGLALR